MKESLVKNWMTAETIVASPDTTLPEAHNTMSQHDIRRLLVVDSGGKLIGIVTRGDVRGAEPSDATSLSIFEVNYLLSRLTLDKIMTTDMVTVGPDDPIGKAANLMDENKVSGLPVVDGDKLVGIITESDIFRMIVEEWKAEGV